MNRFTTGLIAIILTFLGLATMAFAADCNDIDGTWQPMAEESITRFPELAKLPGVSTEAVTSQLEQKKLIFDCSRKRFKSEHGNFKSKEYAFSIQKVEGEKLTIKIPALGTQFTLTREADGNLEFISPRDKYVMRKL